MKYLIRWYDIASGHSLVQENDDPYNDSVLMSLGQVLPNDFQSMFQTKIKWYTVENYKFGDITINQDILNEMLINKELYAYTYAMYKSFDSNSTKDSPWEYALSFRILLGVLERRNGVIDDWLRVNYQTMMKLDTLAELNDAPTMTLILTRTPILKVYKSDTLCMECNGALVFTQDQKTEQAKCYNVNCKEFNVPAVRSLDCFDFDTGPVLIFDNNNISTRQSDDKKINCIQCNSCKLCRRMLIKNGKRCKKHNTCIHRIREIYRTS